MEEQWWVVKLQRQDTVKPLTTIIAPHREIPVISVVVGIRVGGVATGGAVTGSAVGREDEAVEPHDALKPRSLTMPSVLKERVRLLDVLLYSCVV